LPLIPCDFQMRFAAVLLLLVPVLAGKWRATPHGMRPEECILEVPSGSRISEVNGQVRVEAPNAEVTYYPAPAICHTDAANRGRVMHHAHETIPVHGSDQGPPAFPPINGWLDYGGWYPGKPDNNIQFMGATYTVPATPAANNQQVLFYFIGIQDNSSPNAVNILQPVLTFGNGLPGWYVESWACCPTNISVHSSPVTGLKTGTTMTGFVQRQNADVWRSIRRTTAKTPHSSRILVVTITIGLHALRKCTV